MTLSQRLTGLDGLPTWAARLCVAAFMLVAAAAGYAAAPGGAQPSARTHQGVAASRPAGERAIAGPEAKPRLRAAAALPALRGGRTGDPTSMPGGSARR